MTLNEISQLLLSWETPCSSRGCRVFRLKRTWWPLIGAQRVLHRRQLEVLRAIRSLPWKQFLVSGEDSTHEKLRCSWIEVGPCTWILPGQQHTDDLLDHCLAAGGWGLYLAPEPYPRDTLPSLFHTPIDEVCSFLQSKSIPVMVESNHANRDWRIALEPAVVPMVKVA